MYMYIFAYIIYNIYVYIIYMCTYIKEKKLDLKVGLTTRFILELYTNH